MFGLPRTYTLGMAQLQRKLLRLTQVSLAWPGFREGGRASQRRGGLAQTVQRGTLLEAPWPTIPPNCSCPMPKSVRKYLFLAVGACHIRKLPIAIQNHALFL